VGLTCIFVKLRSPNRAVCDRSAHPEAAAACGPYSRDGAAILRRDFTGGGFVEAFATEKQRA
jgi:hypothetical protein